MKRLRRHALAGLLLSAMACGGDRTTTESPTGPPRPTEISTVARTYLDEVILTVSVMADRAKTKYGDQVRPDEIIDGQSPVVDRAITWLQTPNP